MRPRESCPAADKIPCSRAGMTLIELLVAFAVFILLVGALVSLTTMGLNMWSEGETRKDLYERAQLVLESIADDVRNVYVENEIHTDGRKSIQVPVFASDPDHNERPTLRFVRTGSSRQARAITDGGKPARVTPSNYFAETWEVAYVMDPDPKKDILWRGIRFFDRREDRTLLQAENIDRTSDPAFRNCFRELDRGILHVEYLFWSQHTTTWGDGVKVRRRGRGSSRKSGPERVWDSSRRYGDFSLRKRASDLENPDFVYPEIVRITVVMASTLPDADGIQLAQACSSADSTLKLTTALVMDDGPAWAKIGSEWVYYRKKTYTDLLGVRRAGRGTKPKAHPAGTTVRFGKAFTTDVRVAAYREAQEP